MPKVELKLKASVLPIAETALGIAEKILEMVLVWSERADKRGDQKAIKWGKRMERRCRSLKIEDDKLQRYCDNFLKALD